ncbi:MAG: Ni/Fe-hydrogenase cytochrome b subunit, partial [Armatimonadetes bacterium]|nr:Ni/Fe-hydrogenase cytochrome b subunit [Armatimonadota bacterium]
MQTAAANPAVARLKLILWMIVGAWAVVTGARMINGIGASSGLSDATPWGFWIAMVESGVAFAAGGFVIAAVVYIFGIERYHDFARRAILVALLGYLTAATGLFFELGLPWNVWHPLFYWQHHSVLFEVAMCVMCYLTVLALEFSPALLEHPVFGHPAFQLLMRVIKKLTIPLVIAGIMLSTLHQSSLGSLFLIQPYRVHPLWYSPILPVLFYVSAIGLGLMVVTLESLLSGWLFRRPIQVDKLAGLGRIASVVLTLYLLLRLGDLWRRDKLFAHLDGSFESALFMVELLFSAALPAALLAFRRVRHSIPGLATCATLTFLGVVGYRFNICYVAFMRPPEMRYYPTWTEIMVTAGVVAGAILLFLFFNENL